MPYHIAMPQSPQNKRSLVGQEKTDSIKSSLLNCKFEVIISKSKKDTKYLHPIIGQMFWVFFFSVSLSFSPCLTTWIYRFFLWMGFFTTIVMKCLYLPVLKTKKNNFIHVLIIS